MHIPSLGLLSVLTILSIGSIDAADAPASLGHIVFFREESGLASFLRSRVPSMDPSMKKSVGALGRKTQFGDGMHIFHHTLTPEELHQLSTDPTVMYVEEDRMVKAFDQDSDSKVVRQTSPPGWGLDRIDQPTPLLDHRFFYPASAGAGVTIYVIDTGIYTENEDFENRASWGKTVLPGAIDADGAGHGTMVAGIIGGKMYGVAKKSRIVAVKALDDEGSGTLSDILEALSWVYNQHRSSQDKRTIVNLSLGTHQSHALNNVVQMMTNDGILIVSAAGNGDDDGVPMDACSISPASSKQGITVGAVTVLDQPARFSNYGPCIHIWAPGEKVMSTGIRDPRAHNISSGTSFAAPYVSGVAALVWGEAGQDTPVEEVRRRVLSGGIVDGMRTSSLRDSPNLMLYLGISGDGAFPRMLTSSSSPVTPPPPGMSFIATAPVLLAFWTLMS